MAKKYVNRAWMGTATTGTGTVTLGGAVSGEYFTFAEAGISDGDTATYVIIDGTDVEIGTGTYTSAGTLFSRDTVTASRIGGVAGTSKINLSGTASIFLANDAEETAFLDVNNVFVSSDAGAAAGPILTLYRNSASPAASDIIGQLLFQGEDSAGNTQDYASLQAIIRDATSASEDAELQISLAEAGTVAPRVLITPEQRYGYNNAGANQGVSVEKHWIKQAADYTLTSTTTEQKLFNQTTNGRLTLGVGTYFFECLLYLTTMSATSGNMGFDPIGAGTAVGANFLYQSVGLDNTTPTTPAATGGAIHPTQQTTGNLVTAATGTAMGVLIKGTFRITTAGTIIPSGSLTTAAAAVVKANSYFMIWRAADESTYSVGAWD